MKLKKSEVPELWLTAFPDYKWRTFYKHDSYYYNLNSHIDGVREMHREVALIDTATREVIRPYLYDANRWFMVESNIVVAEHLFTRSRDYGVYFTVRPTHDF